MDVFNVEGGEWVFPDKGIGLRMNPEGDRVMTLVLCAAMDLKTYRDKIYFTEQAIEMPAE